jgi:uncharacterized protein DUF4158
LYSNYHRRSKIIDAISACMSVRITLTDVELPPSPRFVEFLDLWLAKVPFDGSNWAIYGEERAARIGGELSRRSLIARCGRIGAVPTVAVEFIAKQVKVAPEQFELYQWRGRTIEYHRAQIRKLHGFRETTVDDAQALSHWLCEQVLPRERNAERLKSAVYDRCRELHLEPPTPERIDRVVRSAARTYEESFCAEILARLSPDNQASLDALLQTAPDEVRQSLKCRGRSGTP